MQIPGMIRWLHLTGMLDTDILRKSLIQSIGKFISGHPDIRVKDSYISHSVNAGIRPTRPHYMNSFPRHLAQYTV